VYTGKPMASPGVYLFTRKGHPVYVGRSDTDVEFRMGQSFRQGRYDLTMTWYETTSARQAYLKECRLFHRHAPCDNTNHPAVPSGTNWRCPISGCPWS
jgi:hypothetical protein